VPFGAHALSILNATARSENSQTAACIRNTIFVAVKATISAGITAREPATQSRYHLVPLARSLIWCASPASISVGFLDLATKAPTVASSPPSLHSSFTCDARSTASHVLSLNVLLNFLPYIISWRFPRLDSGWGSSSSGRIGDAVFGHEFCARPPWRAMADRLAAAPQATPTAKEDRRESVHKIAPVAGVAGS